MNEDDFGLLFETHHRQAYRLALLLCGEPALAEDTVSDAFVAIYPHWCAGKVRDFEPYLHTAVVRRTHEVFRRRRLQRREEQRWGMEQRWGVEPHPDGALDAQSGERDVLRRALTKLPERQRAAIVLRYYGDLSEATTAQLLGISVGTVKAQVSRGLRRLKGLVEEEGGYH